MPRDFLFGLESAAYKEGYQFGSLTWHISWKFAGLGKKRRSELISSWLTGVTSREYRVAKNQFLVSGFSFLDCEVGVLARIQRPQGRLLILED